jgi:hypothetical protein
VGAGFVCVRVRNRRYLGNDGKRGEACAGELVSHIWRKRIAAADLCDRRKFEIEKLNVEDIEMEDLNFYYANYSRFVCLRSANDLADVRNTVYITTSSRCERARHSCAYYNVYYAPNTDS